MKKLSLLSIAMLCGFVFALVAANCTPALASADLGTFLADCGECGDDAGDDEEITLADCGDDDEEITLADCGDDDEEITLADCGECGDDAGDDEEVFVA